MGTHGCTMNLFKIIILEEEIGIFEAKLQQADDVLGGQRGHGVKLGVLL